METKVQNIGNDPAIERAVLLLLNARLGDVTQELVSAGRLLAEHLVSVDAPTTEWLESLGFTRQTVYPYKMQTDLLDDDGGEYSARVVIDGDYASITPRYRSFSAFAATKSDILRILGLAFVSGTGSDR